MAKQTKKKRVRRSQISTADGHVCGVATGGWVKCEYRNAVLDAFASFRV